MPFTTQPCKYEDQDQKCHTWAGYAEAFLIFARYETGACDMSPEHDVIYCADRPTPVSSPDSDLAQEGLQVLTWATEAEATDASRLQRLGFFWSPSEACWLVFP